MRRTNETIWASYARDLRARNRSPKTVETYRVAVLDLDAVVRKDLTKVTKRDVARYVETRLAEISDTSVAIRFRGLRAFFNWAVSEEIIERSPMAGMTQPTAVDRPPAVLRDDALTALIKACAGRTLEDKRDEVLIRVFCETDGPRLGEVAGMTVNSLDAQHDLLKVTGK